MKTTAKRNKKVENPYNGFSVLMATMNLIEKKACLEIYMLDEKPADFQMQCWTDNKMKCIYNGKPTIIAEHINFKEKEIFVKLLQFDSQEMCDEIYFVMTDSRLN